MGSVAAGCGLVVSLHWAWSRVQLLLSSASPSSQTEMCTAHSTLGLTGTCDWDLW